MNLSENAKKLLVNMSMGDGHIDSHGHLSMTHCLKQQGYLEWKYSLLINNDVPMSDIKLVDNGGYGGYRFITKTITWLKYKRLQLYPDGIKIIGQNSVLKYLDELGLAIWYMDDGSAGYKRRDGKIHGFIVSINTYISKEENQVLIDFISAKWGISFNQVKNKGRYRLQCGAREGRKLFDVIRPYVEKVECMKYKIDL